MKYIILLLLFLSLASCGKRKETFVDGLSDEDYSGMNTEYESLWLQVDSSEIEKFGCGLNVVESDQNITKNEAELIEVIRINCFNNSSPILDIENALKNYDSSLQQIVSQTGNISEMDFLVIMDIRSKIQSAILNINLSRSLNTLKCSNHDLI